MNYSPGDWVLVSRTLTKKASNKLKLRWTGPWQVVLVVSFNVYHVRALTGEISTVHASRLWFYEPSGFVPDATLTEFFVRDRGPLEVAEIKALRRVKGDFELLISWLGLERTNDSWEDLRSIYADIPALTNEFLDNCDDQTLAQHAKQYLERRNSKNINLLEDFHGEIPIRNMQLANNNTSGIDHLESCLHKL